MNINDNISAICLVGLNIFVSFVLNGMPVMEGDLFDLSKPPSPLFFQLTAISIFNSVFIFRSF
jgi:hypothetical protein